MLKIKFFIFCTVVDLLLFNRLVYSQVYGFIDDFESYIPGQQLACQNSADWTTWDSIPCDPIEDPVITTEHRATGTKSVKIVAGNELVKPVNTYFLHSYYINFWIYIPSGSSGYFNTLAVFDGINSNWAMECYLDFGGVGYIYGGSSTPVYFNWNAEDWQFVELKIDLFNDQAQFYFDGNLIHTWQWTDGAHGGSSPLSIEANVFVSYEMYIDNYVFMMIPLTLVPLNAPTNLNAEEIFESHQVQLTWEDTNPYEYAYNIIRKDGPPSGPGSFESIGAVPKNTTIYIDSTVFVDSTYTYAVFAYNELGFSDTSNYATILVVVPVELVSFSFEINDRNEVTLSWITATETNNRGFEILRFAQNDDDGWNTIGFVAGHGTTTETQQYSFTDNKVSAGKYQYRLKPIDFDGSFEYSKIVEVTIEPPEEFSLSQNYPNPFNPSTKIKFTIPEEVRGEKQEVNLKIYDVLGNEVATLINEEKPAGEYEVEFNTNSVEGRNLPSGVYFYQLRVRGPETSSGQKLIQTNKMILLK